MSRILCIDYGSKKCGLACTDPLQILVSALKTVQREELEDFLAEYLQREEVEKIVFGLPTHYDGTPTYIVPEIRKLATKLKALWPEIEIDYQDEYGSSKEAEKIIRESGVKKSERKNKKYLDSTSAVLILQEYLGHI